MMEPVPMADDELGFLQNMLRDRELAQAVASAHDEAAAITRCGALAAKSWNAKKAAVAATLAATKSGANLKHRARNIFTITPLPAARARIKEKAA